MRTRRIGEAHGTIRENVAYGMDDADEETVRAAHACPAGRSSAWPSGGR